MYTVLYNNVHTVNIYFQEPQKINKTTHNAFTKNYAVVKT